MSEFGDRSDAELIEGSRRGDWGAFQHLWRRYRRLAQTVIAPLAHADTEDVVSDAFLAIWQQLQDGGGPRTNFRSYLIAACRNLAARLHHRTRRIVLRAELEETLFPATASFEEPAVDRAAVWNAFAALPPRWQCALRWHVLDGLPRAVIADRLGIGGNAVSALLRRARRGMLQRLAEQEEPAVTPLRAPLPPATPARPDPASRPSRSRTSPQSRSGRASAALV